MIACAAGYGWPPSELWALEPAELVLWSDALEAMGGAQQGRTLRGLGLG